MARVDKMSVLNDGQRKFCKEYIVDHNATKAAIRAGYSERTAYSIGHVLLKKDEIQREIQKLEKKAYAKVEVTAEKVKAEIAKIAFVDVSGVIEHFDGKKLIFKDLKDIPDNIRGAIKGIKVNKDDEVVVELWSKEKALDMLGKHFNLYQEHQESGAPKVADYSKEREAMALELLGAQKKGEEG